MTSDAQVPESRRIVTLRGGDTRATGGSRPPVHRRGRIRRALYRAAVLGLAFALAALGCAKPPAGSSITTAWEPTGDLIEVDTRGHGLLLVRRDHQLGRYDDLMIEHVGFRYGDGQGWLSFREENRISAMLASAVAGTADGGIGLTDESGACVLSIRFYISDLELYDPGYSSGSATSFVSSFGEATFIMELRDSLTDVPLARFLQRRKLGGGPAGGDAAASLRRLDTVLGLAMRDMGKELQKITPPTSGGWDAGCDGGMARVALGSH